MTTMKFFQIGLESALWFP